MFDNNIIDDFFKLIIVRLNQMKNNEVLYIHFNEYN